MKNLITLILLIIALPFTAIAQDCSVAGFFPVKDSGRKVWNFNQSWRFHRGDAAGAEQRDYDDSAWDIVSTPHTVQLMPAEDSGGRNYQGIAWYRKTFVVPNMAAGASQTLHFEAIMGKQKIYVNGKLALEHEGGYLPIEVNLTELGIKGGDEVCVAVMADNSDDKTYPPGKTQYTLDFCYHGGIYRDVWLIEKPAVHITDAIREGRVAQGGVFLHYANISEQSAEVYADIDLRNTTAKPQTVTVVTTLADADGKTVKTWKTKTTIAAHSQGTLQQGSAIKRPHLWSPEHPYLYTVTTRVEKSGSQGDKKSGSQAYGDAVSLKAGIRSFEFKGKDGFWLNGKRYRQFVGANRHQDFAYVGNAVPNSQQRRDVQRLKDAGFNLIRTAHYPQDPAFMDACDELGIFIIVATPGWQFWNKLPEFAQKVQQNTRDIVRRDRNHPCVLMWEPILNETRYPEDFALEALKITRDEYPYPYRPVAAADLHSAGVLDNYDVVYAWPGDDITAVATSAATASNASQGSEKGEESYEQKAVRLGKNMLTREFGEYVDDWYAHNNLNRASRSWGEIPQLKQALSLSNTTCDQHVTTGLFLGGCQWHPFDHQRGYHPDPYWGGIYDAFRQPKTAYYMFHSQKPVVSVSPTGDEENQPFVHIAHEMTQFSEQDVVVFSNCDSVRLSIYDGEQSWTLPVLHHKVLTDLPQIGYDEAQLTNDKDAPYNAPVIFPGVWDFWKARDYSYKQRNWQKVNMVAEGIIDGKVVCTAKRMPSRRSTKLRLYADERDRQLVADGSDFIVVVCEVTDDSGNVRHYAKDQIRFTVTGPAEIINTPGNSIAANPRQVEWGTAPILLRSTGEPGTITVHAEPLYTGNHAPTSADLTLQAVPATCSFVKGIVKAPAASKAQQGEHSATPKSGQGSSSTKQLTEEEKQRLLQEVQDQQADFGVVK